MDLGYNYVDANGHNNGNVAMIANNVMPERTQNFTYDSLNRIATAQTTDTNQPDWNGDPNPNTECWAEQYSYDGWGNLLAIAPSSSPSYTGCVQESGFNFTGSINTKNQIAASGYAYDAAGNLIAAPPTGTTYTYDAENHLVSTAGVTYTYDGDGRRVTKSNGTIYSYTSSFSTSSSTANAWGTTTISMPHPKSPGTSPTPSEARASTGSGTATAAGIVPTTIPSAARESYSPTNPPISNSPAKNGIPSPG